MIIPTNPTLLEHWRSHYTSCAHTRPKVPFVKDPGWRAVTTEYDGGRCLVQLIHRREISSRSVEWQAANEIWDDIFLNTTAHKSHRDLDWDYLMICIRNGVIMAAALVEIRCIDEGLRHLYRPFDTDPELWPTRYTPLVFMAGFVVVERAISSMCVRAVCGFASKLLHERAGSPWENAFGDETSKIPVAVMADNEDDKAQAFWQENGFHVRSEDDRQCIGYPSWSAASRNWLPSAQFEVQMVKWIQ